MLHSCGMSSYTSNPIEISSSIKRVDTGDILIGKSSHTIIADSLIAIMNYGSTDSIIHLFNTNDYSYVKSFGKFGPGPNEILRPGQLAYDRQKKEFYVFDYGQRHVMEFKLDSLSNPIYTPSIKKSFSTTITFPDRYVHINDTLGFARSITPGKTKGFIQGIGKFNLSTFELTPFGDNSDKCYENRSFFAVSPEKGLLAEACITQDLLLLYNLDGELITNIKGPEFSMEVDRKNTFFTGVVFADNFIICPFSGDKTGKEFYGKYLVIFDDLGKYIKTLDLGKKIISLCYNPIRNSVYFTFDDETQFGELSLSDMVNAE